MTAGEGGWIDVSLRIEAGRSIAWSGLEPPDLTQLADIERGDTVTVGRLGVCLHTGTHADAPSHVRAGAPAIDRVDPGRYIGPALLVRISDPVAIRRDELRELGVGAARPERLLVATPHQYDGEHFPETAPYVEVDAARWLAEIGVRLLGVNVPSVDPIDSRTLVAHHALLDAGVLILENLALDGVEPGEYELVAVPLPVVGGDASPVRALIRPRVV